jgi:four helix bundle protein
LAFGNSKNNSMRDFRKLNIWVAGMNLVKNIYKETNEFPSTEKFGLTNQMRRAVISIPSNIAEGASRNSNMDFARFLEISLGSSFELETQLLVSKDLKYIHEDKAENLVEDLHVLQKQLNSLLAKVRS